MVDEDFELKITPILSADSEGYSRIVDDEGEEIVRTLTSCRTSLADLSQRFRGRVTDTPMDNILSGVIIQTVKGGSKNQMINH